MRNRNNLLLILLLAGVAYVVFYKKGNGSGNGNGNGSGNGYEKPSSDPDYQVDPSIGGFDPSKFPSAGTRPNFSGTMDIPAGSGELRFL
jgi:hypothetical protein